MTDRRAKARRLDEMAAQECALAKAQALVAEADRPRRAQAVLRPCVSFSFPLLRN
jgi:hypothetical protein